jgi:hypothetical protein
MLTGVVVLPAPHAPTRMDRADRSSVIGEAKIERRYQLRVEAIGFTECEKHVLPRGMCGTCWPLT